MKTLTFLTILVWNIAYSQVDISQLANPILIDFDTGFNNSNSGTFQANGLSPNPGVGELDSDSWQINGASQGNSTFGGTHSGGDYGRGTSSGTVGTGGVYAFDVSNGGAANYALGVQSTGTDFTPGSIVLRCINHSGEAVNTIKIRYKTAILNNADQATSLGFSYSVDGINFSDIADNTQTTTAAASIGPSWEKTQFSTVITSLNIPDDSIFYLSWDLDDAPGGSGSRDEVAIDDIEVTLYNDSYIYSESGWSPSSPIGLINSGNTRIFKTQNALTINDHTQFGNLYIEAGAKLEVESPYNLSADTLYLLADSTDYARFKGDFTGQV